MWENVSRCVPVWLCMKVKLAAPWLRLGSNSPGFVARSYPSPSLVTCTPTRAGVMTRATSLCTSSPRGYTFPCLIKPAALTIISGVMTLIMPRLSSSPQRPQFPLAPHLPLAVQGAGSLASLSSRGYVGAGCCALATPRSQTAMSIRLPIPTNRAVHERRIASSFPHVWRGVVDCVPCWNVQWADAIMMPRPCQCAAQVPNVSTVGNRGGDDAPTPLCLGVWEGARQDCPLAHR